MNRIKTLILALALLLSQGTAWSTPIFIPPDSATEIGYTDTYGAGHKDLQSIVDYLVLNLSTGGVSNLSNEAYGGTWSGVVAYAPTKNTLYNEIQTLIASIAASKP